VAPTFNALLSDSATTFAALQNSALGQTLDQLPPTETLGTTVLTNSLPVLANAAAIVQALKPGAALLPRAAQGLDKVLVAAPPVFRQLPGVAKGLGSALAAVDRLAKDPAATETFKVLGTNDLGTTAASGFVGLGAILNAVAPAQFACNVAGVWIRNFASALSEGDSTAAWLRFMPIIDIPQMLQASTPTADLNLNYYPKENSSECQAGNEVYSTTQRIGDPGQTSTVVDTTIPPAGVLALGKKAGLVP
jgi:hypothetical protein